MTMRTYRIEITGSQPLLMHADSIEWADQMQAWLLVPENKTQSKAGDDRAPAWKWIGSLYHNGDQIVMPTDNIMRMLMEGGAMTPTGVKSRTFKSQTQSGILPRAVSWPLLVRGAPVPVKPVMDLVGNSDFAAHQAAVQDLGFSLFLKRAKIGQSKHIRVRPRFEEWSTAGELVVTDDAITTPILSNILGIAGTHKGLCDWRPGSKTPGVFGMFTATVKQI